jgi:hypothetical protein
MAQALTTRLVTITAAPERKKNGATGKIAPSAKSRNDVPAAVQGEPPRSSGSMPSSSRTSVSSAVAGLAMMRAASSFALSAGRPFA